MDVHCGRLSMDSFYQIVSNKYFSSNSPLPILPFRWIGSATTARHWYFMSSIRKWVVFHHSHYCYSTFAKLNIMKSLFLDVEILENSAFTKFRKGRGMEAVVDEIIRNDISYWSFIVDRLPLNYVLFPDCVVSIDCYNIGGMCTRNYQIPCSAAWIVSRWTRATYTGRTCWSGYGWNDTSSYVSWLITQLTFHARFIGMEHTFTLSEEEKLSLEEVSRGQRSNRNWFIVRCGRITASKAGSVCKVRSYGSNISLILTLCRSVPKSNLTRAMRHGIEHEPFAVKTYEEKMRLSHSNLKVRRGWTKKNDNFIPY